MPNGIKRSDGTMKVKRKALSKKRKKFTIIATSLAVIICIGLIVVPKFVGRNDKKITVASKNYTEQLILGNVLSELIKNNTDIEVEEKFNLGGSQVTFNAITSGAVDLYAEYLGTGYVNILKY